MLEVVASADQSWHLVEAVRKRLQKLHQQSWKKQYFRIMKVVGKMLEGWKMLDSH